MAGPGHDTSPAHVLLGVKALGPGLENMPHFDFGGPVRDSRRRKFECFVAIFLNFFKFWRVLSAVEVSLCIEEPCQLSIAYSWCWPWESRSWSWYSEKCAQPCREHDFRDAPSLEQQVEVMKEHDDLAFRFVLTLVLHMHDRNDMPGEQDPRKKRASDMLEGRALMELQAIRDVSFTRILYQILN